MVWSPDNHSSGYESAKIASIAAQYLQGRFLDLGCGPSPVWPSAIAVDNGGVFGRQTAGVRADVSDLSMFADESMDGVFSSHVLEDFERERVPAILAEWARVLKVGGHLCLYVPSGNLYPRCGQPGANRDHKWDPMPGDIEQILREMTICPHGDAGCPCPDGDACHYEDLPSSPSWTAPKEKRAGNTIGWELLESEERGDTDEYSLWIVARKTESGWVENLRQRGPHGKQRALVVRYGAIGDQIIASSILPGLKKQGYHITYQTTPHGQQVLLHDPNIDEWFIQEKDYVPNEQLASYWQALAPRYDKVINLSESVEGSLLALEGRREDQMSEAARRKILGTVNYLERTHDLADVPHDFAPKFYPTWEEMSDARTAHLSLGGPVVYWAVTGSSLHKIYPYPQVVAAWLMQQTDARLVICGDGDQSKAIQDGILERLTKDGIDTSRIHGWCGKKTVRQSLTFAQVADVVVGPETGILNSVAFENVPKVIYLSHSSRENLTKHWRRTIVISADPTRAPCHPCHRLHFDWSRCHVDAETQGAVCAAGISPKLLFDMICRYLPARVEMQMSAKMAVA